MVKSEDCGYVLLLLSILIKVVQMDDEQGEGQSG
jgi:hypothetical protein